MIRRTSLGAFNQAAPRNGSLTTGRYYCEPGPLHGATAQNQDRLRVSPRHIDGQTSFDRIGSHVTTGAASSTIRWVVYADSNGYPGAVLLDTGAVGDAATTGFKEATISLTLSTGRYWIGAVCQGGAPTLMAVTGCIMPGVGVTAAEIVTNNSNAVAYLLDGVTGAAPNPFTAAAASGGNAPACWLRKAA
jgi:hypothetical protein